MRRKIRNILKSPFILVIPLLAALQWLEDDEETYRDCLKNWWTELYARTN